MLVRNSGIRDIHTVLGVSMGCIAKKSLLQPIQAHYKEVQTDEFGSYVHQRKKQKRWLIYAYAPETKEIIAYVIGKRDMKTVKKRYKQLQMFTIDRIGTDHWKAFITIFKGYKHVVGKKYTKHIEGVNTALRAINRRFVRKTTSFSKKHLYHNAMIHIISVYRNNLKKRYHTF